MGTESANVEILKRIYQQWSDSKAQDASYWLSVVDDDVRLASLAAGAKGLEFSRPRNGKAEIQSYIENLRADWEMIFYKVDEYIASGDRVVVLASTSWRNKKTGRSVTTPKADIWRLRDGRIVEFFEFYDTAAAIAAAQP